MPDQLNYVESSKGRSPTNIAAHRIVAFLKREGLLLPVKQTAQDFAELQVRHIITEEIEDDE